MRAVPGLIGTLDAIPSNVGVSMNALNPSQLSYVGHWWRFCYLQLGNKTREQTGSAAGTVVERECRGQMPGLIS